MFKKILVTLDGSKLAECALPYAETMAQNCGPAQVFLLSVTEARKGRTPAPEAGEAYISSNYQGLSKAGSGESPIEFPQISGQTVTGMELTRVHQLHQSGSDINITFGKMETQAFRYLNRIAKKLRDKGIKVEILVLLGKPAEAITKYAEDEGVDLIVMSSHGRTGPSRWALGSVADKVFRASCVPVLMIRAPGCIPGF